MRPIDADGLLEEFEMRTRMCRESSDAREAFQCAFEIVSEAQTVEFIGEPVIHSVWLKHEGAQKTHWYECANCNTIGSPRWKRCPVCEAKMEVRD